MSTNKNTTGTNQKERLYQESLRRELFPKVTRLLLESDKLSTEEFYSRFLTISNKHRSLIKDNLVSKLAIVAFAIILISIIFFSFYLKTPWIFISVLIYVTFSRIITIFKYKKNNRYN